MNYQRIVIGLLLIAFTINGLTSCFVQNAVPESVPSLIIASDFLTDKDTIVFSEFRKREKIKVVIRSLTSDSILDLYEKNPTIPGYDVVLLKSINDVHKLNKHGILHSIHEFSSELKEVRQHVSTKHNLIGLGLDPYIFVQKKDTTLFFRTYDNLKQRKFINTVREEELIPLFAPIVQKMRKIKAKEWLEKFNKHAIKSDSIQQIDLKKATSILTLHSNYYNFLKKDTLYSEYKQLTFPNQRSSGAICNYRTIGIIKQACNYANAKKFILHYLNPTSNKKLNNHWNTFPIYEEEIPFRKYRGSIDSFVPYYSMVNRILSSLE